ncbi:MFS general substrate transporter [Ophiobolus disseminans]|uniref:MFS general substrate transporter n=1 Tax=Ophiobolus disseminans TaxID=1469910 RepID=A0A6A6ZDP2_9PLEO|nr:MFS general substrate transporter [Ophiobolus disseminans]
MAATKATQTAERTPLLNRPTSASSESSLSISSSDISTGSINSQPRSAHPKTLLDEEATLDTYSSTTASATSVSVGRIVCVLLIGSFISNADGSLLFATHPIIASEFNALHDSSWLMTSFALAQAVTQPLYGKLSDIYGRKSMLILAYTLFAVGLILVGMGRSMSALIVGRIVSGAGSSGMTTLVSILITDLVPLRDVATWRAYVNVVATTGRSIGGPLGGWLADTMGWRYSFLVQVPPAGIAMVLIGITLPSRTHNQLDGGHQGSKLARIDFIGAIFMTMSILGLLFPLEIGGDRVAWFSWTIITLLVSALVFGALFLATEGWVAKEPIIPLSLFRKRDVVVSSFVMLFQSAAQVGLMFAIPLYFQVTSSASNTVAGAHLVPAVVGNAIGGMLSGFIISRTGRYKLLIVAATLIASGGYLLLIVRWHGNTNWLESFYIFPGGFGMGIVQSALFISVQAAIDPSFAAIAASTLYLTSSVGFLAGMAGVSAVLQGTLRQGLDQRLDDLGFVGKEKWKIIEHAVSNVHYADRAKPLVGKAVVGAYIDALTWTHVLSISCSLTAFVGSLFLQQHKL